MARCDVFLCRYLQCALIVFTLLATTACGGGGDPEEPAADPYGLALFEPDELAFGPQSLAEPVSREVSIRNVGTGSLGLRALQISGDLAFDSSTLSTGQLAVGESTVVTMTFTPTSIGTVHGRATLIVAEPGVGDLLSMTGRGRRLDLQFRSEDGDTLTDGAMDFGFVATGDGAEQTIIIANTGTDPVTLQTPLQIDGSGLSVDQPDMLDLASGAVVHTVLRYRPEHPGRIDGRLTVGYRSEDGVTDTTALDIGAGLPSGIHVIGKGQVISDGSTRIQSADGTDFGRLTGGSDEVVTHTFTLLNTTNTTATITDLSLQLDTGGEGLWSVTQPETLSLTPNAEVSFTISLAAAWAGVHAADLHLSTDAIPEPYTFRVGGLADGVGIQLAAVLGEPPSVSLQPISDTDDGIENFDHQPSREDGTLVGPQPLGTVSKRRFRITNNGDEELRLENDHLVQLLGYGWREWSLVQAPATHIPAGESSDFILAFHSRVDRDTDEDGLPSASDPDEQTYPLPAAGDLTGFKTIASARIDSNATARVHRPFVFNLVGIRYRTALTVQALADPDDDTAALPYRHEQTVLHGQDDPRRQNGTDFGGANLGRSATQHFALRNDSAQAIELNGDPVVDVTGVDRYDFSVRLPEDVTTGHNLAPGEQIVFTIDFVPSRPQASRATVTIPNTDPLSAATPYRFVVGGWGIGPRLEVHGRQIFDEQGDALTDQPLIEIRRDDTFPMASNGTAFLPACFIDDASSPSSTYSYFYITNTGNDTLRLGQADSDNVVEVQNSDEGTFSITEQPLLVDSDSKELPRDSEGVAARTPARQLAPGSWARFRIDFNPPLGEPLHDTDEQPPRDIRQATVTIDSNHPPLSDSVEPNYAGIKIQATALAPIEESTRSDG